MWEKWKQSCCNIPLADIWTVVIVIYGKAALKKPMTPSLRDCSLCLAGELCCSEVSGHVVVFAQGDSSRKHGTYAAL